MKVVIGLLLFSFVALPFAQSQCATHSDCAQYCPRHYCDSNHHCHCVVTLAELLGRRQTCGEHDACTCADGAKGHCDHAGVCHCHH